VAESKSETCAIDAALFGGAHDCYGQRMFARPLGARGAASPFGVVRRLHERRNCGLAYCLSIGTRFDADHPKKGALFARRFTPRCPDREQEALGIDGQHG